MSYILKVDGVLKKYGNFKALDGFECTIPSNSKVTGLLGPNGAGKTTFINSMLGITHFSAGTINCFDYTLPKDLLKVKDIIGYMPERTTSIIKTSAMKYVTHFGRLAGLPKQDAKQRAFDVLHYVGLEEARYRNIVEYSTGMIQRVKLATALVHDPDLLILDEPTAGMDPQGREKMLDLIDDLGHNHGIRIVMSTHLLPDIEKCADYVILISQGKKLMQGELEEILKVKDQEKIKLKIQVDHSLEEFGNILIENGFDVEEISNNISCFVKHDDDQVYLSIFKLAKANGFNIRKLTPYSQSLEDIFLNAYNTENEVLN